MLPRIFKPSRLPASRAGALSTYLHPLLRRPQSSISYQPPQPQRPPGSPHVNFYKVYGRALFKALTLAFFSYQVFYWTWLTLETEEIKDQRNVEIRTLENEVKMLDPGRTGHVKDGVVGGAAGEGKRLLEEKV